MSKIEKLKSQNGNFFDFRVEEKESVSVLCGGYAITPDGEFVNVLDDENHSSIFSTYLRAYTEDPFRQEEDSLHAMMSLTKLNHITYMGIKVGDQILSNGANQGYALLVFPEDLNILTDAQKKSCLTFFASNKSIFGNREIVSLQIHDFANKTYTQEELTAKFTEELSKSSKQI